jgi:hypothetical protein
MPPAGGIVVSAAGFSTAAVEVLRQTLWTSAIAHLPISDLPRAGHELSRSRWPVLRVRRMRAAQVFHSWCGCLLYKPVDNTRSPFAGRHLAHFVDFLSGRAKFSTAIVERAG